MNTITNLVVALMIVTAEEEPVEAMPVNWNYGSIKICTSANTFSYTYPTAGQIETLYRKTCKTNFVYSTDINVDLIRSSCNLDWCMNEHRFTAEELFGKRIQHILFYYDDPIYCEKHKSLKYVNIGGAK